MLQVDKALIATQRVIELSLMLCCSAVVEITGGGMLLFCVAFTDSKPGSVIACDVSEG